MSFNYGEKAFKKVRQAIKFVTVVCFGYAMFVWGIIKIIPGFFIKLFNSKSEKILSKSEKLRNRIKKNFKFF